MKITPRLELTDVPEIVGEGLTQYAPEELPLLVSLHRARLFEEAGEYEKAIAEICPNTSRGPDTKGLGLYVSGELYLRFGASIGHLGAARHTPGAQARAAHFIAESIRLFNDAKLTYKVAEARVERARCFLREGKLQEAEGVLVPALATLGDDPEAYRAKAVAVLLTAVVLDDLGRRVEAYELLKEYEHLFLSCGSPILLGRYYNNLGMLREKLAEESGREEYLQAARIDHAGASGLFEEAGAWRLFAQSENNCGILLRRLGRYEEATEHIGRALDIFSDLRDAGHQGDAWDSLARVHIEQRRYMEAELAAGKAVSAHEKGERPAALAEALTTLGVAQVGSGPLRHLDAWRTFNRAVKVAETAGAFPMAGQAALAIVEKLRGGLASRKRAKIYLRACSFMKEIQSARLQRRLTEVGCDIIETLLAQDPAGRVSSERACEVAAHEALSQLGSAPSSGDDSPLFIKGESVRARWLWARREHERSGREGSFVFVDCSALEKKSHYEPGEFTRMVWEAEHGTLVLDELQELSHERRKQVWLLLTRRVVERPGPNSRRERVDVRVIAATSRDLSEEVLGSGFPVELYERLSDSDQRVAPTPKAFEELLALLGCLLKGEVERYDPAGTKLPMAAGLLRVPADRAVAALTPLLESMADAPAPLAPRASGATASARFKALEAEDEMSYGEFLESSNRKEHEFFRKALVAAEGHITVAASLLNIDRRTLDYKLNNYYPDLNVLRVQSNRRGTQRGTADENPDVTKKPARTRKRRR
ncbi:MAG TPA: sigma 54-interacting transcriptional regulator [Pyrinomonadaceae bacterium]